MRVIAGILRGKKLHVLKDEAVRPTTDKVKESVFNIVQFELQDKVFLDLFSGSRQMGIEALSRGARRCFFVDHNKSAIKTIKQNLKSSNMLEKAQIINKDAINFLVNTNEKFDIAFLDPPYKTGILQNALKNIFRKMNKNGIIICESPIEESLDEFQNEFTISKVYKYGQIKITVFRG